MIAIDARLRVRPDVPAPPWHEERPLRGKLRCLRSMFAEALGEPFPEGDLRPLEVGTPGGVAELWLEPDVYPAWMTVHIYAANDGVLPWLYKVITGSTAGFPDAQTDVPFDDMSLAGLMREYANYLRERSRVDDNALNHRALKLRNLVLTHEFAWASPERQAAVRSMPKPARSQLSDSEFWWATGRWLERDRQTPPRTRLQEMLLAHAEYRLSERGAPLAVDADFDLAADDEHTATLFALAHCDWGPRPRTTAIA